MLSLDHPSSIEPRASTSETSNADGTFAAWNHFHRRGLSIKLRAVEGSRGDFETHSEIVGGHLQRKQARRDTRLSSSQDLYVKLDLRSR